MSLTTFQKVLIANRGEIALRVQRALRKLNIACVAIYHHSDRLAPWVTEADEAVEIHGDSPSAAHLDTRQIVSLCQQQQVDAVHPCYGFLSENADFARALTEAGITFIGPDVDAIELMGDKIRSREFVQQQGFPVPPSVTLDADHPDCVAAVAHMRYPLVVKASAGGGGKGMSIVHSSDELQATLRVAASEAEKYFGDKRVYVERYFDSARHIEVQVLGDGENVIHLGERECSIQRRFQKIIEEAPSPALSENKRLDICEVATGIARAANYSSAGTVEFLYTDEGDFYFLEMNTRIQVEHPVTEMIYGVDLVEQQLRIAAGEALSATLPEFFANETPIAQGHAIECRICAEDAFHGFLPETGRVLYLQAPEQPADEDSISVRWDSGLYLNQNITTAFDPMLAKLIVHAENRTDAIAGLQQALKQLVILGVQTNCDHLQTILQHPQFIAGDFDTGFVEQHQQQLTPAELSAEQTSLLLSATFASDRDNQQMLANTPEPYSAIGHWRN